MSEGPVALLPLFPLQTVLFPGGVLPLHVFEARYMDLVTRCLKDDAVFGVNLIAEGAEVGAPAVPHAVGVSARIVTWDMPQPGVLDVVTRGERRFRVRHTELGANGLLVADVDWLPEPPPAAVAGEFQILVALLKAIVEDAGAVRFPPPHHYADADWLGMRFAEVLPIPVLARQRLLELDDAHSRLEIIRSFLAQRGLLGA